MGFMVCFLGFTFLCDPGSGTGRGFGAAGCPKAGTPRRRRISASADCLPGDGVSLLRRAASLETAYLCFGRLPPWRRRVSASAGCLQGDGASLLRQAVSLEIVCLCSGSVSLLIFFCRFRDKPSPGRQDEISGDGASLLRQNARATPTSARRAAPTPGRPLDQPALPRRGEA